MHDFPVNRMADQGHQRIVPGFKLGDCFPGDKLFSDHTRALHGQQDQLVIQGFTRRRSRRPNTVLGQPELHGGGNLNVRNKPAAVPCEGNTSGFRWTHGIAMTAAAVDTDNLDPANLNFLPHPDESPLDIDVDTPAVYVE